MTTRSGSILAVARFGLTAVVVTACGTSSYVAPTGSFTTLVAGWEQHFTLEWAPEPESSGARRVSGYVYNHHGENAVNVRLLAQALDPAGAVVGQRIEWVPGGVNGFGRAYFAVAQVPAADKYRVTVWDYTMAPDRRQQTVIAADMFSARRAGALSFMISFRRGLEQ